MYKYPKFIRGKQVLTRVYDNTKDMMMNITAYNLKKGESLTLGEPEMETAILLLKGDITFYYEEREERAIRSGVFTDAPTCLHVSKDVEVVVEANEDAEILVQSTENDKDFPSKLYRKEDISSFVSCEGRWENTAVRDVVDIINIKVAPYSNMVLGEVYARQG